MSNLSVNLQKHSFGSTFRTDNWWLYPAAILFGFSAFVVYSTWAAFQGQYYWYAGSASHDTFGGYLSPMYSPVIWINHYMEGKGMVTENHSWFGIIPAWMPAFITPAFFVVGFPLIFRFTCYYYRKVY